jgi:enoyl-CoA hydratase
MSTSGSVLSESVEQVAVVRLNRPDKLNALSQAMMIELVELFDSLSSDVSVRVVLLTAAGSRGFCAGRDLSELAGSVQAAIERPMQGPIRNVFEVILECRKPTVAAIFGHTLGGGAELALACDVRIAAEGLQFGFPEVTVGMGANFASVMLPRLIQPGLALDLLYSGRRIDSGEAYRIGLVNLVTGEEQLHSDALRYARSLCELAPLTQQRYKAMLTKGRDLTVASALRLDAAPNPYASNDRIEGVAAWNERRKPKWTGT